MKKENGVQIINVHLFSKKNKTKKETNHTTSNAKTIPKDKGSLKPRLLYSSFHNKPQINYEYLLNKLLKYIKKTFPIQYVDIKEFIKNEIKMNHASIEHNESQSSILHNNSTEAKQTKVNNITQGIIGKIKNEKKLKLSYDFSNLLTSPKPKPIKIEISNIKQVNNNNNNISTTSSTFNTKDIHSLYTIIKKDHSSKKGSKVKPSKTQSNSKSKSTSRDCSNNHYTNTNSNISNSTNNKIKTVKQTLITKSQPLLNEKLFSKLNLNNTSQSTANKSKTKCKNKKNTKYITKKPIPKSSNSKNKKNQNKTAVPAFSYENEKNPEHSKIKSQYIDLNEESTKTIKNEEMMKQIKSTLDDNLKVIFNFSYENFLSKESESESKKSSLHDINE